MLDPAMDLKATHQQLIEDQSQWVRAHYRAIAFLWVLWFAALIWLMGYAMQLQAEISRLHRTF